MIKIKKYGHISDLYAATAIKNKLIILAELFIREWWSVSSDEKASI